MQIYRDRVNTLPGFEIVWQRNANGEYMKPYWVLCLDGDGMRDIYKAAFLESLNDWKIVCRAREMEMRARHGCNR